jgi:hypothetical protein
MLWYPCRSDTRYLGTPVRAQRCCVSQIRILFSPTTTNWPSMLMLEFGKCADAECDHLLGATSAVLAKHFLPFLRALNTIRSRQYALSVNQRSSELSFPAQFSGPCAYLHSQLSYQFRGKLCVLFDITLIHCLAARRLPTNPSAYAMKEEHGEGCRERLP